MDAGKLVSDEIVIALIEERLRDASTRAGAIFDGFPRTTAQAAALDRLLGKRERRIDRAVLIDVPDDEVVRRNSGRRMCSKCQRTYHVEFSPPRAESVCDVCGGELVQRADDRPEKIRARLDAYHRDTAPVLAYYAAKLDKVNGLGSPDVIFERLAQVLDGI
jgi:adenylate kinase